MPDTKSHKRAAIEAEPFSLRSVVREVVAEAESLEYGDLAQSVLATIDPAMYAAALAQALPIYVRVTSVQGRTTGPMPTPPPAGSDSWKVQSIREDWQYRLSEIYTTAEGNKRLGDLTYADLMYMAKVRRESAEQLMAKAKGWETLARAVRKQGVQTVRNLTPEALNASLGAVA